MAYKSYVQPVPSGKVTAVTSYLAVIGIVIYVVSFGLFAVADEGGQPAFGIMCALDALWPFNNHTVSPLVFFGGIINPMIAIYLSFRLFGVAEELRKKLALTICICIPITWISIAQMDYRMLIGHWAWIAGILLILSPSAETIAAGAISRCLALPLLAGLVWFGAQEAIRLPMHTPTAHDDFFYVVAWKSKMPEVCGKICPLALGREDQSSGNGFTFLRSDCYRNLAALAHDPSLCNHVNGANLELLAGSPRAKSACRSQHYTTGTAEPASGTDFFATVKELGYSDDAVSQFHYLEDPVHSMVNDSYRTIRKDPTFRARIQAAPSYDEPIADARIRPANGLEYLYQMLAIDERDVLLCDRDLAERDVNRSWIAGRNQGISTAALLTVRRVGLGQSGRLSENDGGRGEGGGRRLPLFPARLPGQYQRYMESRNRQRLLWRRAFRRPKPVPRSIAANRIYAAWGPGADGSHVRRLREFRLRDGAGGRIAGEGRIHLPRHETEVAGRLSTANLELRFRRSSHIRREIPKCRQILGRG